MENCDWIFALPYFLFATNSHYTNGSTPTPVIFRSWVLWCTSFSFFHSWIGNIWWLLQILHEPNSRCIFASSHPHLQIPVHFGHKYLFLAVMCNHISLRTPLSFCVNSIFHICSLTQHNRICLCKAHMSATAQQSPLVQSWFYYAMIHQSGIQKAHIIFSGKNWKKKQKKKTGISNFSVYRLLMHWSWKQCSTSIITMIINVGILLHIKTWKRFNGISTCLNKVLWWWFTHLHYTARGRNNETCR